tara:strand:+ start:329 stop:610 length:282 start_codon:yes stop_codon:yes gene_type:complete
MALTERTEIDRKEILADGTIQTRTALIVERDGVIISKTFINREVFHPGDDVSEQPADIQALAAIEHTEEKIAVYQAAEAARKAANEAELANQG